MSWTPNRPIVAIESTPSAIVLPPSNIYTCLITSFIIKENKKFENENEIEPVLTLEVINIDKGFSIGGTVKKPEIKEGDFPLYQQFLVNTVSLDRLYNEPKEGEELSKKQSLVKAITGGTTTEHYNSLFNDDGLIGKKLSIEIKLKTSESGNTYITAGSFDEAEDIEVDPSLDLDSISGVLIDKGVNGEKPWLTPWDVIGSDITNVQAQNAIPDSVFTTPLFSNRSEGVSTWDDVKEQGFKFRLLNSKTSKYQKAVAYLPKKDKEGVVLNHDASIAWAKSQGYSHMDYSSLVDYILANDYESHFRFLNKWVLINMPKLVKAGKIPSQILTPKGIDLTVEKNPVKTTSNPNRIPTPVATIATVEVSETDEDDIELEDINFDDIPNPFS